ncbi:MAG: ATP-dependent sacrificial sulfur transferase LarE [Verrucomicrobiales bacterium]|nr:ATP-dependent sacrificial sulfur transferase LarE [Verrucomicrobiota bacterium JB025]
MDSETVTHQRRKRVEDILYSCGSVLVACSGGVDSILLAAVAARALGENAVAATAVSPSLASGELDDARAAAKAAGIRHIEVPTNELDNPEYAKNDTTRCFHCKTVAYSTFADLARSENIAVVVDGTNADDSGDFRPGRKAARDHGVRSPLAEAGMTKPEIRAWARELNLAVWDKPAAACLSSRVPYGSSVTLEKLQRIDKAEAALKAAGFTQCRVRDHDQVARIEIDPAEFPKLLEHREPLTTAIRQAGFAYITLDLQGFRSGSMNEVHSKG